MMKRFVSLPVKVLIVTITALLVTSITLSSMALYRLQAEFINYQNDKVRSGNQQFQQQTDLFKNQIQIWMETFQDVISLERQTDFSAMTNALSEQYGSLQLRLYIEDIWLYQEEKGLLFQTNALPSVVEKNIRLALEFQEPQTQIYCVEQCLQMVAVPILNQNSDVAVVVMTSPLVELRASLKRSLSSEVAIINIDVDSDSKITNLQAMSVSNLYEMRQVFKRIPKDIRLLEALESGIEVAVDDQYYLINLMPLTKGSSQAYYIGLISNISEFIATNNRYKSQVIILGSVLFILLALLVYAITYSSSQRLLRLAEALPLLAKKQFELFRQAKIGTKTFFADELDVLANAAKDLSRELEQLNIQVEQKTQELENIAMYDLLTGLPNRNMLNYQIKKSLAGLSLSQSGIAVLFLDLDDFKKVNDSHGHAIGDRLLIEASKRLRRCIRKFDVACRFGGDEFVIVLHYIRDEQAVIDVAKKILAQFQTAIEIDKNRFYVSTSIGISLTDDETVSVDDMIRQADLAMYEAKDEGGDRYYIYNLDMYQRLAHRVLLESEVREALKRKQFNLSLQPQIDIVDNRLHGFEALLRWHHPERGLVSPDDFIPILENSQHMIELGYWVIEHCFELMQQLHKKGLKDVKIAINLSAGQFIDRELVGFMQQLIEKYQLPGTLFELELTEHTLVKNIDRTLNVMAELKKLGFSFAIDDFGTGYSSLGYLKKMPVEVIKIDKSFVFGMLENQADYQIIMSTIAMVQKLGLQVIAEGVESSAQLNALKENQCGLVQGFYFSRPIPEQDLDTFIEQKLENGYWKTAAKSST